MRVRVSPRERMRELEELDRWSQRKSRNFGLILEYWVIGFEFNSFEFKKPKTRPFNLIFNRFVDIMATLTWPISRDIGKSNDIGRSR